MIKSAVPAQIPLTPVVSSTIAAIGYDEPSQTLAVRFKRGELYHYTNVPPAIHAALLDAESLGSYLHFCIKDFYAYERKG